jgi:EAL domain-containing protein (putative c-di-GMP-specific phosphodiesterase class I)
MWHVKGLLTHLREHCIAIAKDHFGTEYSSLSYLEYLPLGRMKGVKAFVRQLGLTDHGTLPRSV